MNKKLIILLSSSVIIIILDQLTKILIRTKMPLGDVIPVIKGLFNIIHTYNTGVAFGMGSSAPDLFRKIFFLGLPVIACFVLLFLLVWGATNKMKSTSLQLTAYSLILAGAVGNLIDRFSFGFVTDFLDFYWDIHHFATFNVADSAITVAAGMLILDFIIETKKTTTK